MANYSQTSSVILDGYAGATHRHFPAIIKLRDGRVHYYYRHASGHNPVDGATIEMVTGSDLISPVWTSEVNAIPSTSGYENRTIQVVETDTGRILRIYTQVSVPATVAVIKTQYSDDGGDTWTDGNDIFTTPDNYGLSYGRPVVYKDGKTSKILVTVYYRSSTGPDTYRLANFVSTDDGLNFSQLTPVVDDSTGYTEHEVVIVNDDLWFAVARTPYSAGTGGAIRLFSSVDESTSAWSDLGNVTGTLNDEHVAPTIDKFEYRGEWYLAVMSCNRDENRTEFHYAKVEDVVASGASAFSAAIILNTDMFNLSGYQCPIRDINGCLEYKEGIFFAEGREYAGYDRASIVYSSFWLFDIIDGLDGTWTVTVRGSTTAGTPGYVVQSGRYTKIGNLVVATYNWALNSKSGMAGNLQMSLPFPVAPNSNTRSGSAAGDYGGFTLTTNGLGGYGVPGAATMQVTRSTTTNATAVNVTETGSSAYMRGVLPYWIA